MKTPQKLEKTTGKKSASDLNESELKTSPANQQHRFDDEDDDDFDVPLDDVAGLKDFSRFDDDDDY